MIEKIRYSDKIKRNTTKVAAVLATSALGTTVGCSTPPSPVVSEHVVHVDSKDTDGTPLRPGEAAIKTVCFEAFRQADEELGLQEIDAREDLASACRDAAQIAIENDTRGVSENLVDENVEVTVVMNDDDRPEVTVRQITQ